MERTITVTARMKAKRGMEGPAKQELLALTGPTRAEAGCISYDLHCATADPSLFLFFENWRSKEDLDRHLEMPYIKEVFAKAEELFEHPPEVTLWEHIG